MATAGRPVVFAGGTVVVSILGLAVANVPFMTVGGLAVSIVVLIMVVASVTLLPAFLGPAGPSDQPASRRRPRPPRPCRRDGAGLAALGRARHAGTRWRTRSAPPAAAGAAAPVLGLRVGLPDDGSLPEHRTERRAYDLVAEGFGPGTNGPLVVAVDLAGSGRRGPARRGGRGGPGHRVGRAAARSTGDGGIATLVVFPTTGPQDRATADTVARLRADVLPTVVGREPGHGPRRRRRGEPFRRGRRSANGCRSSSPPCWRCRSCC